MSDTALKHLFDIKDENCQVYMSQLGIRCVGTFQLRGIPGEEKITEVSSGTTITFQIIIDYVDTS